VKYYGNALQREENSTLPSRLYIYTGTVLLGRRFLAELDKGWNLLCPIRLPKPRISRRYALQRWLPTCHHCGFVWSIKRVFVVLFSLPRVSTRNHCRRSFGNQNKANGPTQITLSSKDHIHEDATDQVILIRAYFSTSSCRAVSSERARAGCRKSGCVSATTAFTVSVGFFKSSALRIELSFITILKLITVFFHFNF